MTNSKAGAYPSAKLKIQTETRVTVSSTNRPENANPVSTGNWKCLTALPAELNWAKAVRKTTQNGKDHERTSNALSEHTIQQGSKRRIS